MAKCAIRISYLIIHVKLINEKFHIYLLPAKMHGLRKIIWSYTIILFEAKLLGRIIKHEMCISPIMTKNDNNFRYLFLLGTVLPSVWRLSLV